MFSGTKQSLLLADNIQILIKIYRKKICKDLSDNK